MTAYFHIYNTIKCTDTQSYINEYIIDMSQKQSEENNIVYSSFFNMYMSVHTK